MDCEKFDLHLVDALYGEIDEVTELAMRRHAEACARCRALESSMQATLDIATLPMVDPSPDLEERILAAAAAAARPVPAHRRLLRAVSWIGSHAMRPQLAMAALLMLVLGSSLLLLRARPGAPGVTPVSISEHGAPQVADEARPAEEIPAQAAASATSVAAAGGVAQDKRPVAVAEAADATADSASAMAEAGADDPSVEVYNRGLANYRAGNHQVAQRDFEEAERQGGATAPSAALFAARAVRSQAGCGAAVPYYNSVRERYGTTAASAEAAWEQADCYNATGNVGEARKLWLALRDNDAFHKRAELELSANAAPAASAAGGATAGKAVAAPAPAAAPPGGGSGAKSRTAAPDEAESPYSSF